jgi:cytoskeletal protein CcmA (bactofilin family)
MKDTPSPAAHRSDERGIALVTVLLLLMMMSALGMALAVNGETETLIARNQISGMQAQAAAEAGLNHAVEVAIQYIFDWQTNGFSSVGLAVDDILTKADAGVSVNATLAFNSSMLLSADLFAEYEVEIIDDDDSGPGEDGDPLNDVNGTIIIRAIGWARDGLKVVLEALIAPTSYGAILTNGDLELAGNTSIEGDGGSVHANGDLDINGSASVDGDASATGDIGCGNPCGAVGGTTTEGAPEIEVPEVNASDYLGQADYILNSDGTVTNPSGTVVCDANGGSCFGWDWDGSGTWSAEDPTPSTTYYVEGNVDIGSNDDLVQVSIIAEGDVDMTANSTWTPDPDAGGLLLVSDGDFQLHGNPDIGTATDEGKIMVKGQIDIHGNTTIHGQLIMENQAVGNLTTSNILQGSVEIHYSGGFTGSRYTVTGWRDVRDAN